MIGQVAAEQHLRKVRDLVKSLSVQTPGFESVRLCEADGSRGDGGVDPRPFFHPLSSLPAYADRVEAARARERNLVSYSVSPYRVNPLCAGSITRREVALVAAALRDGLTGGLRRVA